MKTLYIVRHAKSTWRYKSFSDFERPLRKKGVEDLRLMTQALKEKNIRPDILLTSPAVRAVQTAVLLSQGLEMSPESIAIKNVLYPGTSEQYLDCILELPQEFQAALIVGHHPAVTDIINLFLGEELLHAATSSVHAVQWGDAKSWKKCITVPGQLLFAIKPKSI